MKNQTMSRPRIICFGEVLWDVLLTGKIPGGAPMNVAFHLNNFGLNTSVVSSIGRDEMGRELLAFLKNHNISTDLIQSNADYPTGKVDVTLDEKGSPSYEIVRPVAWDYIELNETILSIAKATEAIVFGSLACRNTVSEHTLVELAKYPEKRIFDVNLRPPFYNPEIIDKLLQIASIVKMNDEELEIITRYYKEETTQRSAMEYLSERFNLDTIIVTKGAEGVALLTNGSFYERLGYKVEVKDTIGSGDAFLAAYIKTLFDGLSPDLTLDLASAAGALVATHQGATPDVTFQMLETFVMES